jgi:hypothetical protein
VPQRVLTDYSLVLVKDAVVFESMKDLALFYYEFHNFLQRQRKIALQTCEPKDYINISNKTTVEWMKDFIKEIKP